MGKQDENRVYMLSSAEYTKKQWLFGSHIFCWGFVVTTRVLF